MTVVATSKPHPIFLAGRWVDSPDTLVVDNPADPSTPAGATFVATEAQYEQAVDAAVAAFEVTRTLPAYERGRILREISAGIKARREELGKLIATEAGKPVRDALVEVDRATLTFRLGAEEAERMTGELIPLDLMPASKDRIGITRRFPIGPIAGISPFNFPLNLAAHKIAPAIASGCTWVMKPASRTPIGALIMGEALAETDLPKGAFSILPAHRDGADLFTEDDRLKLLSFTGSPAVGWELKAKAGRKKVVLELGGNAACLVDADQADRLDHVVERLVFGAFYQSGQSCISVQRILAHAAIYDALRAKLVAATKALKMGDPRNEDTFIGPMISENEARRLEGWVAKARAAGAKLLCGGGRDGAMLEATVLEDVPADTEINCEEAFGPVVALSKYDEFEEALHRINASKFGLQAGLFTTDIGKAMRAWDTLEVGGVVINDVPSWRVDNMPYGGVKDSGLGREGVRYAIEDMTEIRLLVIRD
jgi:aldehyde dehydrogenase (NAD+)